MKTKKKKKSTKDLLKDRIDFDLNEYPIVHIYHLKTIVFWLFDTKQVNRTDCPKKYILFCCWCCVFFGLIVQFSLLCFHILLSSCVLFPISSVPVSFKFLHIFAIFYIKFSFCFCFFFLFVLFLIFGFDLFECKRQIFLWAHFIIYKEAKQFVSVVLNNLFYFWLSWFCCGSWANSFGLWLET